MSSETVGALSLPFILVLIALRIHVALVLLVTGGLGFWLITGSFETVSGLLAVTPFHLTANFTLAVVPLYIMMGVFAGEAGFGEGAYFAARKWLSGLPGGIALATIVANAFFGAACGSSVAACAVFTKFSFPEMKRAGYHEGLALATITSAGVLSMLIPPSFIMLIYGMLTEVSIGKLFMAGIFPGILLTVLYGLDLLLIVKLNPKLAPDVDIRATWRDRIASLRHLWGIVVLAVLVLGGIYAGIFTATEAGGVGAFAAFVLALASRRLTMRSLWHTLQGTGRTVGMIFLILIGALVYSKFLIASLLPTKLIELLAAMGLNPIVVLVFFILMYVILGCFLDSTSMMLITIPITFTFSQSVGWDPVWFGIVIIVAIEMGLLTPPFALNVFTVKAVAGPDVDVASIFKWCVPYLAAICVLLVLLIAFPDISTFLPKHMG